MTKQETYDYLRAHGVDFEITEHKAVFNMEECADLHLPYPESEAKNLFIREKVIQIDITNHCCFQEVLISM